LYGESLQAAPRFPPVAVSVGGVAENGSRPWNFDPVVATNDAHINESRVAGAGKVAFEGGGAFLRDTRREVALYLSDPRTSRSGIVRLYAKTVIAVAATVISYMCLLLAPHDAIVVAACFAGLAIGLILTALCVQHDANHGAYFRKERHNHLLGWTADALLGSAATRGGSSTTCRDRATRESIGACYRGATTWQRVCAEFDIDYAQLPDTIDDL
jgi:hypothetical protein